MLQAWYWDYPKDGCNSYNGISWAKTLQNQAADLNKFSHVWLPPLSRASFGSCSNGYDPKDLFDIGGYGLGPTGFGTEQEVKSLINTLRVAGIDAVADVVYNHRDGGAAENNPSVKQYIETAIDPGESPFPSDRYRCILPVGGSSPYGAGHYYIKISSKTGNFGSNHRYKLYLTTNGAAGQGYQGAVDEAEPNGGGDCGQSVNDISLNQDMRAYLGNDGNGCGTDEFHLELMAAEIDLSQDTLYFYLNNIEGGYSDHRVYGIWYDPDGDGPTPGMSVDLAQYQYQTYTNFFNVPSGKGKMDYRNFRPNPSNVNTTGLSGDQEGLWFFYDYDQNVVSTSKNLINWSLWLAKRNKIGGFRMDAVKHFSPSFVSTLMNFMESKGVVPSLVVGEYFDFNPFVLKGWVDQVQGGMPGSAIQIKAFDFSLRSALKDACENFGYDVRNVFNSGMVDQAGGSGFQAVTFINNHDFRTSGEYLQTDPMLAYAYILTNNRVGLPAVFYPDYFGIQLPYHNNPPAVLKPEIDALIDLHQNYIAGAPNVDYVSRFGTPYQSNIIQGYASTTLLYQISGGVGDREVLVVINFAGEELEMDYQVPAAVGTNFAKMAGQTNGTDNITVGAFSPGGVPNYVYMKIPARSYAVYVEEVSASAPRKPLNFNNY